MVGVRCNEDEGNALVRSRRSRDYIDWKLEESNKTGREAHDVLKPVLCSFSPPWSPLGHVLSAEQPDGNGRMLGFPTVNGAACE